MTKTESKFRFLPILIRHHCTQNLFRGKEIIRTPHYSPLTAGTSAESIQEVQISASVLTPPLLFSFFETEVLVSPSGSLDFTIFSPFPKPGLWYPGVFRALKAVFWYYGGPQIPTRHTNTKN
jgi:hypothetical protein